jgi:hypothetical protein
LNSTVVIDLDENDQIVKLEDKWNGQEHPTRFGALVSISWFFSWTLTLRFYPVVAPFERRDSSMVGQGS